KTIEHYPFLGPITDFFVGVLDQTVEKKINQSADKLAEALTRNPELADELISAETQKVTSSVDVKPKPSLTTRLRDIAAEMKLRLKELRQADERIDSLMAEREKVEATKTPQLITDFLPPLPEIPGFGPTRKPNPDDLVDCYCGPRFIGTMK